MKQWRGSGIIPIVVLLVAVFGATAVSTGAVYWVKQKEKKPTLPKTPQPTLDVKRALTPTLEKTAERSGTATISKPAFTMKPPQGWVRPSDVPIQADFHFAAPEPDFFEDKTGGYFSNIIAQVGPHQKGYTGVKDYQKKYRNEMTRAFSGVEILSEGLKTVKGYKAYYIESITPDPKEATKIHRLQYLYIVDANFVVGALGSTLDTAWDRDAGKIKASLESIVIEKAASPTPLPAGATPAPTGTFEYLPEYQPGQGTY